MLLDDYEEFTEGQRKTLEKYVTNTSGHVFVLRNLPEVIKGALFSRYSRSSLGLRSLLLKEFVKNEEESAFSSISGKASTSEDEEAEDQEIAIKKAQNFYDRILDGYGDDSIGELGGAHLAIENVSMIGAKIIEDKRIGGSPLEKSTRYIYFDQKVNGEYLFYKEPILMTSAHRDLYLKTCNRLFDTYSQMIPPLTEKFEQQMPKDPETSNAAYRAALRAKVLDCLRGLLPAGTLTNMGIFGNGRFYESLIHTLHCSNLQEMQDIGKRSFEELEKVVPSFIRRAGQTHHTHASYAAFFEAQGKELKMAHELQGNIPSQSEQQAVTLIDCDPDSPTKVAAALLFAEGGRGLNDLLDHVKQLPQEEVERILEAGCSARENRRHKSPRALEHASFTFELVTDFGIYRDLHRHRMLTQERQLLSCDYGYFTPPEIEGTKLEGEYHAAMEAAKQAYDTISSQLPEEAQYIVPMAYNVRWYFHVNLRALQWLCELRSQPAGHPQYRYVAQEMARQVSIQHPSFERYFRFVDYGGYEMGRMGQEVRKQEKLASGSSALN